jgi:peptide/nickel transport system substrate-binding protein
MTDKIYNFKGDIFAPDYDLFLWYWYSDPDPNFLLSVLTTAQVGSWSDTQWSDAGYDKLYQQQQTTIDDQARKQLIWKMQQLVYRQSPYVTLTYPEWLEAYNDGQWAGWVKTPSGDGPVIYTQYNVDSYLFAHPKPATEQTASGGSGSAVWAFVAVAAVAAVIAAVILLRRRGRRAVEE